MDENRKRKQEYFQPPPYKKQDIPLKDRKVQFREDWLV